MASQGKTIFFGDWNQGLVGALNPSTNQITLWPMPGAPYRAPERMTVAGSSSALQVWTADETGVISMLNPATNTFTEWRVPQPAGSLGTPFPFTVAVRPDGSVLFQDFANNMIGVLNPATNLFYEWRVPTASSQPLWVASLSATVALFTETSGNKIGSLDLTSSPVFQAAVTPTVMAVTPVVNLVTPAITAIAQTITPVMPVSTGASRTVTLEFMEYPVPTASGQPWALTVNSNGALFFSENNGNKVGLLQ